MAIVQILFAYSSGMARYLLPLLPPMVLLAFLKSAKPVVDRGSAALCAVIGLVLGICLSLADFQAASVHYAIARDFGFLFKQQASLTRFGGEWGFRHYMLEQGFRQFLTDSDNLAGGTFIISPREAVPYSIAQDVQSMLVPVRHDQYQGRIPIRLMNRSAHAGFYSSSWGLLPYTFSRAPVEEITVQQVSYISEKLPEIQLESPNKLATILPVPNGTGVDTVVPVPSRISIPYDGAPVRIQFSCIGAGPDECPIRVWEDPESAEISLHKQGAAVYFDLEHVGKRNIVLEIRSTEKAAPSTTLTIRNWVMLPLGHTS
jgi:hypothetical protein